MRTLKQYINEEGVTPMMGDYATPQNTVGMSGVVPYEAPALNGLCILKPEFLEHSSEFMTMLKNKGWNVIQKEEKKLSKDIASKLYDKLKDEKFYPDLCDYMSSDKCLCVACHKDCEDPIKDMKSIKDRVRKEWGKSEMKNAMHSSDSLENVEREYKLLFSNQ